LPELKLLTSADQLPLSAGLRDHDRETAETRQDLPFEFMPGGSAFSSTLNHIDGEHSNIRSHEFHQTQMGFESQFPNEKTKAISFRRI
jgi:hypothetical protein